MLETDLQRFVRSQLIKYYGKACHFEKNAGGQFVTTGRPDIEGSIYGRHVCIEFKSEGYKYFTDEQKHKLKCYHRSGSLAAGIIQFKGSIYWLDINQVLKQSFKDISKWYVMYEFTINPKGGLDSKGDIDFGFLMKYLNYFWMYYVGDFTPLGDDSDSPNGDDSPNSDDSHT